MNNGRDQQDKNAKLEDHMMGCGAFKVRNRYVYGSKHIDNWGCGAMATRLPTEQKIPGSTPGSLEFILKWQNFKIY